MGLLFALVSAPPISLYFTEKSISNDEGDNGKVLLLISKWFFLYFAFAIFTLIILGLFLLINGSDCPIYFLCILIWGMMVAYSTLPAFLMGYLHRFVR